MKIKIYLILFSFIVLSIVNYAAAESKGKNKSYTQQNGHTFTMDSNNFLLDGKPFQISAGEMHYSRIPKEYWRHRIQMAKAMGCNTIATIITKQKKEVLILLLKTET